VQKLVAIGKGGRGHDDGCRVIIVVGYVDHVIGENYLDEGTCFQRPHLHKALTETQDIPGGFGYRIRGFR